MSHCRDTSNPTRTFLTLIACLALLTAALPGAALAQNDDDRRWYAGATVGRTYNGADFALLDGTPFGSGEFGLDLEEALSFGAVFGRQLGRGWRVEAEYLYRTNDLERLELPGGTLSDGDYSSVTIGAHLLYDFLPQRRLRPYIGVGFGWIQEVDIDFGDDQPENSFEGDGSGFVAMAGLAWDVTPRWTLDFQVRSFDGGEPTLDSEAGLGTVKADYAPVNLQLGFRWRF